MSQDNQTEQYRQMKQIVASLMGQDPAQWKTLAAKACGDDKALEALVLDVLQQMEEETGELELPVEPVRPNQLGPYRIVSTLGEGGMGVVYLAQRTDQFHQKVAIKCLRSEFAKADDIVRFNMERQILAKLNHPHIARILDGGVTKTGMPYFVMEYVEGMPLTKYANHHQLDLKARLKLVQQICSAVHYANQNLIVHRDLKPGNILVQADGSVKLLDFGIAKLLGHNDPYFSDLTAIETRTGMSIMTLQYASPEQYLGKQATVATDVYALGLLLYELLAGQRAYSLKGLSRPQVSQVILKQLPTKPSRLLETGQEATLQTHGVTPKILGGTLKGDLDCIVMMALRKEPERRYSSAFELNQDIQAYLKGLPVSAHPEKWSYNLSKFVARNKLLVGFGLVLLASLFAITALSVRFANITRAKNTQIAAERDEAEAISKFLVKLLEGSDPLVQNANPTLKEVLLRARKQLEEDATIDQEARTQLNISLLGVFLSYELNKEAETLIAQMLNSDIDELSKQKVRALKAVLLGNRGELRAAEKFYIPAIDALTEAGEFEFATQAMIYRGIHLIDDTQYFEGINYLQDLLESDMPLLTSIEISAWRNIGRGYSELSNFDKADTAFDKAEALIIEHLGPDAMALFDIQLNRIVCIAGRGDFESALALAETALPNVISVLGETHTVSCGALLTKATCLAGLQRHEEALKLREQALECTKKTYGMDHFQVIYIYSEIGLNYSDLGHKEKAIEIYREAIDLADTHLREGHLFQALTRINLGSALDQVGRYEEALAINKVAYEKMKQNPDAKNYIGVCAFIYGTSLTNVGQLHQALPLYAEALEVAKEFPNRIQYTLGLVYYHVALIYEDLGDYDKASEQYVAAFDDFLAKLGPDHPNINSTINKLKTIYDKNGTPDRIKAVEAKLTSARAKKQ